MMKSIWIVDWLMMVVFVLMLVSKVINLPITKVLQPIFFVLIIIHIAQHWKVIVYSLKGLMKR